MSRARRRRRSYVLESLEGRELLSAAPAPFAEVRAARVPPVLVIQGTLPGVFSTAPLSAFPPYSLVSLFAAGRVSSVGAVTVQARALELQIHASSSPLSGAGVLASASKGAVAFNATGNVEAITVRKSVARLSGQVTGGTGLFAGATGTVSVVATLNSLTQRVSLQIRLRVNRA